MIKDWDLTKVVRARYQFKMPAFHSDISLFGNGTKVAECKGGGGEANKISGVFSTGAMAPVILRKRLIAPAVSNRNGKILLTPVILKS